MRDPKQTGNPASQRQAKIVRAEIADLKARQLAIREEDARLDKIIKAKEPIALALEVEYMSPDAAARFIRYRKKV